ncbi:CobW/HypB/UreG, nucleotide-binding domain-containing protein [Lipomyces japonicus]|uniref:CobW/HypB/UreG, nucleotide-binding domain-containing protein n=1 Tax=Lipomyces japonicus TaxID=56871 RepID=UPI0034CDC929
MTIEPTPITVFTGFLGAGKTTLLISLLKQLPKNYKVAVLKNEYGDVKIDSALAASTTGNIAGVTEMLNGCLCCVLTGQMRDAIIELQAKYNPDRILIETSGSAFPATISIQLRDLAKELSSNNGNNVGGISEPGIRLDGVVNVIDVENFTGYADTSKTAALQAQYTDLIVFNKWQAVSERKFDTVWDRVNDLNTDTPKIKSGPTGTIPWQAILGIDSKLGLSALLQLGGDDGNGHDHDTTNGHHEHESDNYKHGSEIETLTVRIPRSDSTPASSGLTYLFRFLETAPKDEIYRIKFILQLPENFTLPTSHVSLSSSSSEAEVPDGEPKLYILNWAFGRYEFTRIPQHVSNSESPSSLLSSSSFLPDGLDGIGTIMVGRGDGKRWKKRFGITKSLGEDTSVELS